MSGGEFAWSQGPPAAEAAIRVENLTAAYGDNVILRDVSFEVTRGEVVVIAGGSGCGKSTLLKHMIGLHPLAGGRVEINGVDIAAAGDRELSLTRQGFGVLFQSGALFGSLTLLENITLPLNDFTSLSPRAANLVARAKLAMVGLAGYENHLPSELSGGMQKRAGLARAMALDPAILFFDEPSAGLDPITAAELDRLIIRINQAMGTTMVIVTHELASIYNIAHRVVMLDKSVLGIIAQGPPKELRDTSSDPRVADFFHRRPSQKQA
ncbi:polyamine ABC transporter ATP-binding protein [Desulfocarbo indianensis]|nr:polyamine ABC transporter ATP-binding protein [Desulfocarbo indianensis]